VIASPTGFRKQVAVHPCNLPIAAAGHPSGVAALGVRLRPMSVHLARGDLAQVEARLPSVCSLAFRQPQTPTSGLTSLLALMRPYPPVYSCAVGQENDEEADRHASRPPKMPRISGQQHDGHRYRNDDGVLGRRLLIAHATPFHAAVRVATVDCDSWLLPRWARGSPRPLLWPKWGSSTKNC
jgi:hypothetical protein